MRALTDSELDAVAGGAVMIEIKAASAIGAGLTGPGGTVQTQDALGNLVLSTGGPAGVAFAVISAVSPDVTISLT